NDHTPVFSETRDIQGGESRDIEFIPIVDVRAGDYALSLNEKIQQIEPHRINGLLDMGIKPVFKLTTASGRFIKTTGNHPYLTKEGWKKVVELSAGQEIAVPKLDSMESIAALSDNSDASKELFFGNPAEKIFDNCGNFANAQKIGSEKDNSAIRSGRIAQDISEVRIAGNKYKGFSFDEFVDFLIRGASFNITDIHNLVPGFFKDFSNRTRAVCVNENFHGLRGRLDNQFLFVSQKSGIQHTSIDIFCSNWAEFVFNLLKIHPGSHGLEYNMHRSARAFNTGFTMLDFRVYADMFVNHFFMEHFGSSFTVLSEAYHIIDNLSSRAYADVTAPAPVSLRGVPIYRDDEAISEIASLTSFARNDKEGDILWDKIISIEYIGREHVYDIEVEGTHNFIGNGIFAHNTYITSDILTPTGMLQTPYGGLGRYENLLTYSEQLDNAIWVKTGLSITANSVASPNGATTADSIVDDVTGGGTVDSSLITATAGQAYTFSVWLKGTGSQAVSLKLTDNATTPTSTTQNITLDTTWQRYSVTHTLAAGSTKVKATINHTSTASDTVYVWGSQLEQASSSGVYASSTSGTVTASRGVISTGDILMPSLKLSGGSITDTTGTVSVGSSNNLSLSGNLQVTGTGPHYISQGNVGIGTTGPDSLTHIEGNTTGKILHVKQNHSWSGAEWGLYVEGYSYLNGFRINANDGARGLYNTTAGATIGFAGNNADILFSSAVGNQGQMVIKYDATQSNRAVRIGDVFGTNGAQANIEYIAFKH
ncbi:MAG: hypothetical protein CO035_02995, partial [Candidatus Omnitrophica bacterium CG_4_9_14_0_2_um_filter_42_8]